MKPAVRHSPQSGFAMLLVFALAAAVAILLYMELPRVAFEAQRNREQFLIDRGEQYQRAIQLFFRKTRTYPATLEQLESTNNIRFLRRRYKDPMTGKDEWRIIHMGPGGMLTDSLVQKPPGLKPDEKDKEKASASSGTSSAPPAVPGQPGAEGPLAAVRRRPSEMGTSSPTPGQPEQEAYNQPSPSPSFSPSFPGQPDPNAQPGQSYPYPYPQPSTQPYTYPQAQPGQPQAYSYPQTQPGQPVPYVPGQPYPDPQAAQIQPYTYPYPQTQPGQPQVLPYSQLQPGQPQPFTGIQVYPSQSPASYPTQVAPAVTGPFGRPGIRMPGFSIQTPGNSPVGTVVGGMVGGGLTGGVVSQPYSASPYGGPPLFPTPYGTGPSVRPVPTGGAGANPALDMIQRILTTPRPGGLPQTQGQNTFTIGGGIAGVATTLEAEGIKVYNERTKYNEWEFIYDFRKDRSMLRPGTATSPPGLLLQAPQSPVSPLQPGPTQPGTFTPGR